MHVIVFPPLIHELSSGFEACLGYRSDTLADGRDDRASELVERYELSRSQRQHRAFIYVCTNIRESAILVNLRYANSGQGIAGFFRGQGSKESYRGGE